MPTGRFPEPFLQDSAKNEPPDAFARRLERNLDALDAILKTIENAIANLTIGAIPSGAAGGALDGTYPNPGIAASVAGSGLAEASNVLSVNVDSSTIEINADTLRVKDDGITAAKIATDAVGSAEIAANAVGSSELADDAVDTAAIQADAVTYAKIQNVSATDKLLGRATAGAGDVEEIALTSAGRALIDDASASAQRTTLGLGTMAVEAAGDYALLASPAFTGNPTAPTPSTGDADTSIATTAFVANSFALIAGGLRIKAPVNYVVNADADWSMAGAFTQTGSTIDANSNGALTIQGISPAVGSAVLLTGANLTGHTTGNHGGIWNIASVGSAGTKAQLTRDTSPVDFTTADSLNLGTAVTISGGNYANQTWYVTVAPTTINTDATLFTQFTATPSGTAGGALDGSYPNPGLAASVAGNGLAESSDVLSVNVDGSTLEISSDSLRVKDGGITFAKLGTLAYICIQDQQTAGTNAGGFTSGAWRTRTLNTEQADTGNNASLSSNQITLAAGTYRLRASAPAFLCSTHKTRLRNVTDGSTVLVGTSEIAPTTAGATSRSFIEGRFTIAASKALEVQHQCATTRATDGFGQAANLGEVEVYTTVELWRES